MTLRLLAFSQKLARSQRPLRALTAWRYLPRSDQSCLCRANRRTALANLHHLPQVLSMRSKIRSFNCNSFLVQVGVCVYTRYTAALFRKTSRKLLSLEPDGVSHLHSSFFFKSTSFIMPSRIKFRSGQVPTCSRSTCFPFSIRLKVKATCLYRATFHQRSNWL